MRHTSLSLLSTLALSTSVNSWTWPNPRLDALDDIYTIAAGAGRSGLVDGVNPCGFAPSAERNTGRQAAAEWVRVAYHDMATHNIEDGTGGIDSSIGWETDRSENIGTAMNTTLQFFLPFTNKFISMSDMIALGTIFSLKMCRGPSLPFRTGRIDASGPGPSGVPEPHQDLASHTASFERQGFNQADMIGLVACGHTMGGVHEVDFPHTVSGAISSSNTEGMVHFDDTFDIFDNRIATEWLQNTTSNPLAIGSNTTTNSDARIFAADGNVTIRALAADNANFVSRCGKLLMRMIDTVPSSVQLSDPTVPLAVKPYSMQLSLDYEGQLRLAGYMRIFDTENTLTWSPGSMPVDIKWKDRTGASCTDCIVRAPFMGLYSTSFWGNVALFRFNQTIAPTEGISSFVVDWSRSANGTAIRADNGGSSFTVQDVVMLQPSSCVANINTVNLVAAVRNDVNPTEVYVDYSYRVTQPGTLVPRFKNARMPLVSSGTSSSPLYALYKASFEVPETTGTIMDLVVVAGGKTYKDGGKKVAFVSC